MPFNNKRNSRDDKSKRSGESARYAPKARNSNFRDRDASRDNRDSRYKSDDSRNNQNNRDNRGGEHNRGDHREQGDRPYRREQSDKPYRNERGDRPPYRSEQRDKPYRNERGDRPYRSEQGDKPYRNERGDRPYRSEQGDKPYRNERGDRPYDRKSGGHRDKPFTTDRNRQRTSRPRPEGLEPEENGLIRLNRYIANSGICSRRKADEFIQAGVVTVNGNVVTELGVKVDPQKDEIRYNGERLKREKMIYVLLNKPKDYITTTDDPQERRTVMHLVANASRERIYPVGRLDRNTTGLLLLTNDGNLAEKLSHPRNQITKIYHVELSKNLTQGDFNKIAFGLELEDGFIKPDTISYVQGASRHEVGIQIHSGKNRIVRRIFEHLGYEVIKLDRVIYANLTKKDLPRGRWRFLEEKEIIQLKHFIK